MLSEFRVLIVALVQALTALIQAHVSLVQALVALVQALALVESHLPQNPFHGREVN